MPSLLEVLSAISAPRPASVILVLRHQARVTCQVNDNTIPPGLHRKFQARLLQVSGQGWQQLWAFSAVQPLSSDDVQPLGACNNIPLAQLTLQHLDMQEKVQAFLMGPSAVNSPSPCNIQPLDICSHVTPQSAHAWARPAQMKP